MSLLARLLKRLGYFRAADYGLVVTDTGQVLRVADGAIVNAAPILPPHFRPPTPPQGFAPRSAIPAPIWGVESTPPQPAAPVSREAPSPPTSPPPVPAAAATPRRRIPAPPVPRRPPARRWSAASERTVLDRLEKRTSSIKTVVDRSSVPTTIAPVPSASTSPAASADDKTLDTELDGATTHVEMPVLSGAPRPARKSGRGHLPASARAETKGPRDLLPRLSRRLAERKRQSG